MSTVLNTVYNNYLTTYAPKSVTRYDTHKKSELRNVYNTIVKLNKESPWYLPTTSRDTQEYAVSLKENARSLHNTLAELGGLEESGLLNKKTAYSTKEEVASASFIGTYTPDSAIPSFTLEVHSLATPQQNLGHFLPQDKVALSPDTYSFDISINDMNYEFQFSIGENESNQDIQERLARLITNADIGLHATVEESEGRTALKLESVAMGLPDGKNALFTVSDTHTSKTSGAVAYLGLDYVSKEPSNAHFLLNGENRSAASNHFTVGKLFEVQLHGISSEEDALTIGLKTDIESMTDNVVQLVDGYNSFLKAAAAYQESQPKSSQLIHEFSRIASHYHNALESMGINQQADGTLAVDKGLLSKEIEDSKDIHDTFSFMKDFSGMLLRKSNQVSINPMNYVQKTIVAYKNPGHNFASPYVTSTYSGMMFSSYC